MSEPTPTSGAPADIITSAGAGSLDAARKRRERIAEIEQEKKTHNADLKALNKERAELEEQVRDDYGELGTDTARAVVGDTQYTVYLTPKLSAGPVKTGEDDRGNEQATDEDWARACAAMRALGRGDIVREQFNLKQAESFMRELREEHGPGWKNAVLEMLPEELRDSLKISEYTAVAVKKAPQ